MHSFTLRHVKYFDFSDEQSYQLKDKEKEYGSISKLPNQSRNVNGITFEIYQCRFLETITEEIIIDGEIKNEYQKAKKFNLFYSRNENLLILETSTVIAKNFLKRLLDLYPKNTDLKAFQFDFEQIKIQTSTVKGIYFNVDDDNSVDSKAFFGNDVDRNDEANEAIVHKNATYLIINLDVANKNRTIGFSQKSAIVLYNNFSDEEAFEIVTSIYIKEKRSFSTR